MKLIGGLVLAALLLAVIPAHADQVDYTLSVQNAPGGIGDFSWTIQTDGFIQPLPAAIYDSNHNCLNCDSNFFTSFVTVSAPSNGEGCGISKLFLVPDYGLTTFFSPLCDGLYDSTTAGALPDPGVLGTWSWQGTNPDDSQNYVTLTITDPPGTTVPEPQTWAMLFFGLIGLALMKFAPQRKRLRASLPLVLAAAIFAKAQPGHL
jgi:hypothetical protein